MFSRRDLLKGALAGATAYGSSALTGGAGLGAAQRGGPTADLLLANGRFVDGRGLVASALTIRNGRITGVGEARALGPAARTIDLGGRTVVPGLFDAHVHYNLDIGRPVSVGRVFELWREAGIRGVLLTSRPNDGTRELLEKAPAEFKTVAFARPYVVMADVYTWFRDPAIYAMIEQELARGIYAGIGEFHIFGRDADRGL